MTEQVNAEQTGREIALKLEKTMRCNCDLDNWEREWKTGHTHVCRIHKATIERLRR